MTTIDLTVNGRSVTAAVEPRQHLADFLREHLRLTGTHLGCEHGVCGACTIEMDGMPARSCIAFAAACDGMSLRTIEGFDEDPLMAELREAFSAEHALQCGFCTPGMLVTAHDIVQRLPDADEKRIRLELAGNLCRCTGYAGIVNAIKRVLAARKAGRTASAAVAAPAAAPFVPFAAAASAPAAATPPAFARASAGEPGLAAAKAGWTELVESFVVRRPPAEVWRILGDLPMIAACLPGAELDEHDARNVKGRMRVKVGPIAAAFAGAATIERDEARMAGTVRGAGSDGATGSRTRGEVEYALQADGAGATRVAVTIRYSLQGALAQFSRSNVARDLARRLIGQFAANLDARLDPGRAAAPGPAAPGEGLDLGRLVWAWIKDRLARLFGRNV
ncbi:MAG: 2Fe-2S iron-sulfur cluster-binding protein [Alphaproteobacteria bacterium]|nr:2Fe-2S iron-sulfur cluster-binding protein [Alphaproteobacteria bacterium]